MVTGEQLERLIEERKSIPLDPRSIDNELAYAAARLEEETDPVLLVFPTSFLQGSARDRRTFRDLLMEDRFVSILADLGPIGAPMTHVQFALLGLTRNCPTEVRASRYLRRETYKSDAIQHYTEAIGKQKILPNYRHYLNTLAEFLSRGYVVGRTPAEETARFFTFRIDELDQRRLYPSYYDPALRQLESEIANERTRPLGEVADIARPFPTNVEGRVLSAARAKHPLNASELLQRRATNQPVQQFDLVATQNLGSVYLVTEAPEQEISASSSNYLIRPRLDLLDVIDPYYLALYLQSNTARNYAERFFFGGTLPRISVSDLRNFPIVVPDPQTVTRARETFHKLYVHPPHSISEFNESLYKRTFTVPGKGVQNAFLFEELERLRLAKRVFVNALIQEDLREMQACIEHELYKSFVILCGSATEAALLDWLSEAEDQDYFRGEQRSPSLFNIINRLYELGTLTNAGKAKAHTIRENRNIVHPTRYLDSDRNLTSTVCKRLLENLQAVLTERGFRF